MNLKQLAERAGKTAQQIAVEAGVGKSTVDNWHQLLCVPRMSPLRLSRVMGAYGCTFEELIEAERLCVAAIKVRCRVQVKTNENKHD